MSAETKTLAEDFNDYESMWKDSASWVTASGNKINSSNNTNNKYKEKLQKLVDYHITNTIAHDAKAHGRWKPTANMNIKALDETADSAFLTFTETCYRGQAATAEERMIDAFYDKQTKKFKILFFLDKKLTIRKEGAGFNDMMEELCFFFRSPKFGTPERQNLMEWVDKNGNKITASSKATTAKQHPLNWPYANRFEKIIEYHMRHTPGTKVLKKDIAKYVFQYEELKKNGVIIDIIAGIDNKEDYLIKVFQDRTNILDTFQGTGYENFLTALENYMILPNKQDPEYQNLLIESVLTEFVDKNGTSINLNGVSTTPTSKSATTGPTKIHDFRDKYDKLVTHLRSMYSLNVNRRTAQLLDVDIKVGTKFKNKLIVTYDYQKDCLVGALYDEFGREVSSNDCLGGWSVLIAWLKKEGFPLISHLCENNSDKESCKFPFSKEDLDVALDNLTQEEEPGLELGDNFENSDVLTVAGEPYGGTKWYVDKWADNLYIITSELWGQDGGGPEEGVYEELESIDEVWDYLNKLDQLSGVPALKPKKAESMLTEWKDSNNQQITITGHPGGWNLCSISSPEVCEGCGQIVEFNPNLKNNQKFFEPYILQNKHKLCSECMVEWIKLPKGFIDKFLLIGNYDILGGDLDEFIEELKLTQPDINGLIQEWNNKKKQGLIELSQAEILEAEDNFIEAIQKLGLTANSTDFI